MFISAGDARLFSTSFGPRSAPVILGIGGWIGSWELWAEPFSILSESLQTIAYDHRGSGATIAPVQSITFENLVSDVFTVLDAYKAETCVLAAESAGALTALGAALAQPKRISRLVIVDGMYHRSAPPGQDRFLQGLRTAYPATLKRFMELCIPEPGCEHIVTWGRQILDRASPEGAVALYEMAGSVDLRAQLGRIDQRTLVVHGALDAIVPLAQGRALASALPNARLVVLDDAGHVPTMTRPVEVARAISEFLSGK